jgi:hypothetical protein
MFAWWRRRSRPASVAPLSLQEIRDLSARYHDDGLDDTARGAAAMFCLLVDVADAYLMTLEAWMPVDRPESDFLGGVMPIDALVMGLEENLRDRQETGTRLS